MSVEDDINRLFEGPLEEFTPARDELSKRLRAAGDTDGAARVKALRKPNLASWGLNQLAHRHPDELDELFMATESVRETQRRVMSGGKADLRAATDERNAVVAKLTRLAAGILEEAGHAASPQTMSLVSDALVAVASDEQGAEVLRAGRLSRELKPGAVVDVGVLGVVESEPDEPVAQLNTAAAKREAVKEAEATAERASREADAAEAEARRLADEAEQADRRAKSAAEAAEFARRAAEGRRADADEAAARVKGLHNDSDM